MSNDRRSGRGIAATFTRSTVTGSASELRQPRRHHTEAAEAEQVGVVPREAARLEDDPGVLVVLHPAHDGRKHCGGCGACRQHPDPHHQRVCTASSTRPASGSPDATARSKVAFRSLATRSPPCCLRPLVAEGEGKGSRAANPGRAGPQRRASGTQPGRGPCPRSQRGPSDYQPRIVLLETSDGFGYRYTRGDTILDPLVPEGLERQRTQPLTTSRNRPALPIDGGNQALLRVERLPVHVGGRSGHVRRPTLLGALVLKAAAFVTDSRDPEHRPSDRSPHDRKRLRDGACGPCPRGFR